jgi:hypothetical protein
MIRSPIFVTCALSLLISSAALADNQGQIPIHLGSDVLLGPRLSASLETAAPKREQGLDAADQVASESPQPAPRRKVRVVYPAL